MERIRIVIWIYCIISGVIYIWLSEHLELEDKRTGEKHIIGESRRAGIIGSLIAINWLLSVPIIILPMIKKGG